MRTLLISAIFFFAYGLSIAQEKKEPIEKEIKIQSSEVKVETKEDKTKNNLVNTPDNLKKKEDNVQPDQKKLPQDFPKFEDTGNPEIDKENYFKRKEKWISENPEKYKALFDNNSGESNQNGDREKPHAVKVVKSK